MKKLLPIVFALALLAGVACAVREGELRAAPASVAARPAAELKVATAPQPAPEPAQSTPRAPFKLPLAAPKIVVSKSGRRLSLYDGERLLRTYTIALGLDPVEDKVRQGDYRTPEGEFYVFTKNSKSAFYLSLGLSYPNAEDAERGLRDKLITRAQYESILRAIRRKGAPPRNTRLGGDIYLHGGGTGRDWTWGCVALSNEDIKELFDAIPVGTTVVIEH